MELVFHWIRYVLILWGLLYIGTQSAITFPVRLVILRFSRFFGALVFCPACSGFWVGLGMGFLQLYGPPLAPNSLSWAESALIATVLGYFWGMYFGDAHSYQKALHLVEERAAQRTQRTQNADES